MKGKGSSLVKTKKNRQAQDMKVTVLGRNECTHHLVVPGSSVVKSLAVGLVVNFDGITKPGWRAVLAQGCGSRSSVLSLTPALDPKP